VKRDLPGRGASDHPRGVNLVEVDARRLLTEHTSTIGLLPALELRVGIHTGPVISGVVGNRRFSFDIWGDAVNTASFMEAHCPPGQINISETVAGYVKASFEMEARGTIKAKHDPPVSDVPSQSSKA
jgi:class 3 adenylate cyclase